MTGEPTVTPTGQWGPRASLVGTHARPWIVTRLVHRTGPGEPGPAYEHHTSADGLVVRYATRPAAAAVADRLNREAREAAS